MAHNKSSTITVMMMTTNTIFMTMFALLVSILVLCGGSASAFVLPSGQNAAAFGVRRTATTNSKTDGMTLIQRLPAGFVSQSTPTPPSSTTLFMGWGPDPIWSDAKITSSTVACPSETCVTIVVEVDPEVGAEYKIPGQYVQVRLNDEMEKPLFLAMSSAPTDENTAGTLEFLVKKTDNNEWLTQGSSGMSLQVSQVLGGGFPMQDNFDGFKYDFPTQNVLLFAVGSGIAPIKASIESGQLTGSGRSARLYYGVQSDEDLCFVNDYAKWEEQGIQVVPVLSQPNDSWQGRTGYVQNALEEDGVPIPRNSGALLCGMKGMAESVKDVLMKAGVFEGRILTNF